MAWLLSGLESLCLEDIQTNWWMKLSLFTFSTQVCTVDYLIMHSFFEHLFPLHGWPRTLHQKIVTYSCRLPSLIVESQKWMYSLEWHTLGMLHKNMHYEIVNCRIILPCSLALASYIGSIGINRTFGRIMICAQF